MKQSYTDVNAEVIAGWVADGWEWGKPIAHEQYEAAKRGDWQLLLTPTIPVPRAWYGELKGAKVLGLASGGAQQMPLLTAAGARCTVLDYTPAQLESEHEMALREGYAIELVCADMSKPLPFANDAFDLIFHPVSNCYVEDVYPIWRECYRVLKPGGRLLAGLDNGICYAFNDEETALTYKLPFNPLKDEKLYAQSIQNGWGIQFSHTIQEQVGGQLKAGFTLKDIYQDTAGSGALHEHGVPAFWATLATK
ncbi:MAG: methyltransferase domain-containing protein [Clostridia bacterium]